MQEKKLLEESKKMSDIIHINKQAETETKKEIFQAARSELNKSAFTYILSAITIAVAACYYYDQSFLAKGIFSAATIALGGLSYNHLTGLAKKLDETNDQFKYMLRLNTLNINQNICFRSLCRFQKKLNKTNYTFEISTLVKNLLALKNDKRELIKNKEIEDKQKSPTVKPAYTAASIFCLASVIPHLAPYFTPYLLNCSKYLPFLLHRKA